MNDEIKVLFLEDDAPDAEQITRQIKREARYRRGADISVTVCNNMDAFRQALQENDFSVVLVDFKGPNFSGEDAIEVARHAQPDTPIIIVTGSLDPEAANKACALGASGFFMKGHTHGLSNQIENAHKAKILALKSRRDQELLDAHAKSAQLGELISGVAHDFNNDLHLIGANVDLLERKEKLGLGLAEEMMILGRIIAAQNHAAELVRQLLNFSRGTNGGEMKPLTPDEVLRGLVVLISTFPKSIRIESQITAGTDRMMCNKVQLQRALLNLCTNARDAMPNGGKLTITATNADIESNRPDFPGTLHGRFVCICVSDTGSGIPEHLLSRLWETFFTTKQNGHGIGLSQVRNIIQHHGGGIRVSSDSTGTTFNVFIPAEKIAPEEKPQFDGSGKSILLVDDMESMLALTAAQLETAKYKVTKAINALEALALCRSGETFDLVIADYVMPLMNGGELLENLRALKINVPGILVTGIETGKLEAGDHVPVLKKPYSLQQLLEACDSALKGTNP